MLASATDIKLWANNRDSQDTLPRLVRRLIHATVPRVLRAGLSALWAAPSVLYMFMDTRAEGRLSCASALGVLQGAFCRYGIRAPFAQWRER